MILLETIKCKDGVLHNLEYHQERFDKARAACFSSKTKIDLSEITVPQTFQNGLLRCRVLYSNKIEKIEFLAHEYRKVESLMLVKDETIDYSFKDSDREHLNNLFEKRGECDDILIVKKGCITDSFTANPIFFDGEHWWTPDTPLLAGTQRAYLLSKGIISTCKITPSDLKKYKKVGLINALQTIEEMPVIEIKDILSD